MEEIAVSVLCMVYNHEKYLRKCLDGFVMQKTNFKFEVIVHDDASTDHSTDIIKEYEKKYPNLIKSIYQTENQYSKGVKIMKTFMFPMAKGKYIASCEGDDYWCDENKLQKQYEIMEENPKCHLCVHKVCAVKESGESLNQYYPGFEVNAGLLSTERFMEILGVRYPFQTSSYFRRTDDMREYINNPPKFVQVADVGDVPQMMYLGLLGDVYYLDEVMSCYRKNSMGSWSSIQKADLEKRRNHSEAMVAMYDFFNELTNNKYKEQLMPRRKEYYLTKCVLDLDKRENARTLMKRENSEFFRRHSWKNRVYIVLKAYVPRLVDFFYTRRG